MSKKPKGFKDEPIKGPTLYFQGHKIIDVEDGKEGYQRVKLVESVNPDTGEENIEVWDITGWELEVTATPFVSDATTGRNERAIYVVDKLYELIKDLDVRIEEIPYSLNKLLEKCKGVEEQVRLNLLGKTKGIDVRIGDWDKNLTDEQK